MGDQPLWRTVTGGSAQYVEALVAPLRREGRLHLATPVLKVRRERDCVEVLTKAGPAVFDHVVVAVHADQALELLADPSHEDRATLGAFRYQRNQAVLHSDIRLMPANRRVWAAWNYVRPRGGSRLATLTYDLNRLQGLDVAQPVLVSLNQEEEIDPAKIVRRFEYHHPVVDDGAVRAQSRQQSLSRGLVSFCGAYWGYGFHEDGVNSAVAVCERFGVSL